MGNVQMDKGELDAAIESFQQALKIKPYYAVSYYNLGNVQSEKGDPEAAIESYKQALKINPDSLKVYFNLGNILKNLSFTKPSSDMQNIILSLLEKKHWFVLKIFHKPQSVY